MAIVAIVVALPALLCAAAATSVTVAATACLGFDFGDYLANQVSRYDGYVPC